MRQRIALFLLICLSLFIVTGQVFAQDDREDETHTGDITSDTDSDSYTITLDAGETVVITAIATEGSQLDTYLTLADADGNTVAENDDYEFPTSVNSQIIYEADATGDYNVIVSNYPGSSGEYELMIDYGGDNSDTVTTTTTQVDLPDPDFTYNGYVDDDTDDTYTVTLEAGQGVIITAVASGEGTLDTYLSLLDPDGVEVAINDDVDFPANTNSEIVYVADVAGDYSIIMSNYPGSGGDYDLSVTLVTEEQASAYVVDNGGEVEINTTPERASDLEFSGTLASDEDRHYYPIEIEAGQGIIAAAYETDGNMDTVLTLIDPNGVEVLYNDDRGDDSSYNSQIAFTAEYTGKYTVVVDNYPDFYGDYRLEIYFADAQEVSLAEQAMRELFSGTIQTYDTENFRIHYTLEGNDATTIEYVELVGETVEEVLRIQTELGWVLPPSDLIQGGDGRYDVYLINLPDLYGYASSSSPAGDNPNTEIIEEAARAGYLVLDNDYTNFDDPMRAMFATAAHEFHHIVQFGYDDAESFQWYYEATASWMETVTFPEQEEATIYVEDVFGYPEACFGGQGDADPTGLGVYGTWLFFEYIQANVGENAPIELWENTVIYEDWEALEITLDAYNTTIPATIARYHINNLVRDYQFTFAFEETTVRLEETITGTGSWTYTGAGIQEMGANFFAFNPSGRYEVRLDTTESQLELYMIGITGDAGEVVVLNDGGTIDTSNYEYAYLMVFNPDYDGDLTECEYVDYEIVVVDSTATAVRPTMDVDTSQFRELQ